MAHMALIGLQADSDGLHAAAPDPWWREAWYFEFFDPSARLQFQLYQGVFPNAGTGDLCLGVFLKGQPVLRTLKMDYTLPLEPPEERLRFGPAKLELVEPFRRWRIWLDTDEVQAELEFSALHSPFSWSRAQLWMESAADPQQRSQHFDQFGRYTGRVWVGGREIVVDALGFRDRMWGWGGRRHWRSYVVLWAGFGADFVANVAVQTFADGRRSLCGYLFRDGEEALLSHAGVEVTWDPHRWKTVATVAAEIADERGRTLQFTGRPQGILDTSQRWPHRRDHMLFTVAEYACSGRTGYGVMNWAFATEGEKPRRLDVRREAQAGKQ